MGQLTVGILFFKSPRPPGWLVEIGVRHWPHRFPSCGLNQLWLLAPLFLSLLSLSLSLLATDARFVLFIVFCFTLLPYPFFSLSLSRPSFYLSLSFSLSLSHAPSIRPCLLLDIPDRNIVRMSRRRGTREIVLCIERNLHHVVSLSPSLTLFIWEFSLPPLAVDFPAPTISLSPPLYKNRRDHDRLLSSFHSSIYRGGEAAAAAAEGSTMIPEIPSFVPLSLKTKEKKRLEWIFIAFYDSELII